MSEIMEAVEVFTILSMYGSVGTGAGVLMHRVLASRGNIGHENMGPAALMAGVFWPIGLWVAIAMYFTGPHLPMADQRELRRRSNAALKEVQLLQIEEMEFNAQKARFALELENERFHNARMRAINARSIDDDV